MYNNTVKLTGNIGIEAKVIEQENGTRFASLSIATTDSYKDADEQWQQKETVWHRVLAFNPQVIEILKGLKTGTRVELDGSLSYRPFNTVLDDGRSIQKQEVTIVAHKLTLKPLVKKSATKELA